MEILTFNEIIQFIKKETEGVDMEWKEDVILKPMENPTILIDDLKKKFENRYYRSKFYTLYS